MIKTMFWLASTVFGAAVLVMTQGARFLLSTLSWAVRSFVGRLLLFGGFAGVGFWMFIKTGDTEAGKLLCLCGGVAFLANILVEVKNRGGFERPVTECEECEEYEEDAEYEEEYEEEEDDEPMVEARYIDMRPAETLTRAVVTTTDDRIAATKELKQAENAYLRLLDRWDKLEYINGGTDEQYKKWRAGKQARSLEYDLKMAKRRVDNLKECVKEMWEE